MSGCAGVSRHNRGSPDRHVNVEVHGGEPLAVERLSPVQRGYAPVSARNHADQLFGGGMGDDPRAILTSGCERSPGRIPFDSVNYGDDRGSDDGVVMRGFAVE